MFAPKGLRSRRMVGRGSRTAGYCPQGNDLCPNLQLITPNARRAVVPGLKALFAEVRKPATPIRWHTLGAARQQLGTRPRQICIQSIALRMLSVVPEPRPANAFLTVRPWRSDRSAQ